MKKLLLCGLAGALIIGCSGGDAAGGDAQGKAGEVSTERQQMKGVDPSQVMVTNAGGNADKMTGSRSGN